VRRRDLELDGHQQLTVLLAFMEVVEVIELDIALAADGRASAIAIQASGRRVEGAALLGARGPRSECEYLRPSIYTTRQ